MSEHGHSIGFDTRYSLETGRIEQSVYVDHCNVRQEITRRVLDTMDADIVKALIALGWTPPPSAATRRPRASSPGRG